jgi:hypothetical protein
MNSIITASGVFLGTFWEHHPFTMRPMKPSVTDYHAWLLRIWRETPYAPWRIALEHVSTGERKGFADLDALLAYLQTVYTGSEPDISLDDKGE